MSDRGDLESSNVSGEKSGSIRRVRAELHSVFGHFAQLVQAEDLEAPGISRIARSQLMNGAGLPCDG